MLGDRRATLILLLVLCFAVVSISEIGMVEAEPKTIVVPDDYATITAAIDSASEGDTIFVKEGTYNENLEINKTLSLLGEDKETTIIDGGKVGTVVNITQNSVKITGFTIRNSSNTPQSELSPPPIDAGILLYHNVHYCNITGNYLTNNKNGIIIFSVSSNNNVFGNKIIDNKYGISLLYSADNNTISGNEIRENDHAGIYMNQVLGNIISANNITNNNHGILTFEVSYNKIIENQIENNNRGISSGWNAKHIIYHNNFINNPVQVYYNSSSVSTWDNGSEGNYWDDYTGVDNDGDGIGDTPYVIDDNNRNNFPLMNPWIPPNQKSEPFPITWILVIIGIIAIVGVAILVFFIKTKKTRDDVK